MLGDFDIFGVPVYKTESARRKAWAQMVNQCDNAKIINCSFPFVKLSHFVISGFLSPRSASYFLTGRASSGTHKYLDSFSKFYEDIVSLGYNDFKIYDLWLTNKNAAVPENTFLFPLVGLDSDPSVLDDTLEYRNVNLLDLAKL